MDFKCDKCGKEITFDEVGYLGADTDKCHPFLQMTTLCINCNKPKQK